MCGQQNRQHAEEIRRDGEVAAVVKGFAVQAGLVALGFAAGHRAANDTHDGAVAVIGPAVAVLIHTVAEFRHHNDGRVAVSWGHKPFAKPASHSAAL
jgi:hypothetical protein